MDEKNSEQRAKSNEQRAKTIEQKVTSNEQEVTSNEQWAKNSASYAKPFIYLLKKTQSLGKPTNIPLQLSSTLILIDNSCLYSVVICKQFFN